MPARPRGRQQDPLAEYRAKRDPARTAEPVPAAGSALPVGNDDTFVVQEHHTPRGRTGERVHWDLRLERDGVLKSWAVPKGPPTEQGTNRLAVPTEDAGKPAATKAPAKKATPAAEKKAPAKKAPAKKAAAEKPAEKATATKSTTAKKPPAKRARRSA